MILNWNCKRDGAQMGTSSIVGRALVLLCPDIQVFLHYYVPVFIALALKERY